MGADVNLSHYGTTPLHYATLQCTVPAVSLLLEAGADLNARTQEGKTPLHFAASGGFIGVTRLLLNHGADIEVRMETNGTTPLYRAAWSDKSETIKFLAARGAKVDATVTAGSLSWGRFSQ